MRIFTAEVKGLTHHTGLTLVIRNILRLVFSSPSSVPWRSRTEDPRDILTKTKTEGKTPLKAAHKHAALFEVSFRMKKILNNPELEEEGNTPGKKSYI